MRECLAATRQIHVGKVPVGGDAPITVQSMTNTLTSDANATIRQIKGLEAAGAEALLICANSMHTIYDRIAAAVASAGVKP